MTKAKPTLQVPGAKAQATKPDAAVEAFNDDLAAFESDDLPPVEPPSAQELQAALAQSLAVQRRQQAQIDALLGKASAEANVVPLPTVAAAMKEAAESIAAGKRPRPILTGEGWYCHPELARVAVHGEKK
jgi:hypothetical protein